MKAGCRRHRRPFIRNSCCWLTPPPASSCCEGGGVSGIGSEEEREAEMIRVRIDQPLRVVEAVSGDVEVDVGRVEDGPCKPFTHQIVDPTHTGQRKGVDEEREEIHVRKNRTSIRITDTPPIYVPAPSLLRMSTQQLLANFLGKTRANSRCNETAAL